MKKMVVLVAEMVIFFKEIPFSFKEEEMVVGVQWLVFSVKFVGDLIIQQSLVIRDTIMHLLQ